MAERELSAEGKARVEQAMKSIAVRAPFDTVPLAVRSVVTALVREAEEAKARVAALEAQLDRQHERWTR